MTVFSDAAPEHAETSAALLPITSTPWVLVVPSARSCHKGPSPRAAKSANPAPISPCKPPPHPLQHFHGQSSPAVLPVDAT